MDRSSQALRDGTPLRGSPTAGPAPLPTADGLEPFCAHLRDPTCTPAAWEVGLGCSPGRIQVLCDFGVVPWPL